MKIAPGIHRLGTKSIVNAYLIDDGGAVTVIDAGMPGLYGDIPRELAAMGRSVADVRALVLTHGHSDHIGFAERLRREHEVPVWIHDLDAALARGEVAVHVLREPVSPSIVVCVHRSRYLRSAIRA